MEMHHGKRLINSCQGSRLRVGGTGLPSACMELCTRVEHGILDLGLEKGRNMQGKVKTSPTKQQQFTQWLKTLEIFQRQNSPWKQCCATGLGGNGGAGSSLHAHCVPNPDGSWGRPIPQTPNWMKELHYPSHSFQLTRFVLVG